MRLDLTHNKIVSDTVTEGFLASVEGVLVPLVNETLSGVVVLQMYEDYLKEQFLKDGRWFYPFSALSADGVKTVWASWSVDKKRFRDKLPYSFVGEGTVDFRIEEDVPEELSSILDGRSIYADSSSVALKIFSPTEDPTFLAGRYSQSFVDEMARQLTDRISSVFGITGLADSVITLELIFAPDTYMEHTSENVTYRRLRLADRTSAPRDLWVKWTRTDAGLAYSVSDTPENGTVIFELAEDVPEKIREKEYRYLLKTDAGKFKSAMTRKNITEWRELIKRAIKRGELVKDSEFTPIVAPIEPKPFDIQKPIGVSEEIQTAQRTEDEELMKLLAGVATGISSQAVETTAPNAWAESRADSSLEDEIRRILGAGASVIPEAAEISEAEEKIPEEPQTVEDAEEEIPNEREAQPAFDVASDEERIRREIEAKLRLEYENRMRVEAELEAKRLAEERERLRLENERLQEEAKKLEEIRLRERIAREQSEERLRAEIEAKTRAEAREKERLAEAAQLAVEEKQRLERVQAEAEARLREAEQLRLAELEKQKAAKLAEEQRLAEEREAKMRKEEEELAAEALAAEQKTPTRTYNFTSKKVLFFFRADVPANITASMEGIIRKTLEENKKTAVPINIRASVVSDKSVCLDFVKIPAEEEELLISIVQALGKGGLGIVKARVE